MSEIVLLAQEGTASINLTLPAIIALIAGIIVLLFPKVLNYVVGIYLIVIALIEMFDVQI